MSSMLEATVILLKGEQMLFPPRKVCIDHAFPLLARPDRLICLLEGIRRMIESWWILLLNRLGRRSSGKRFSHVRNHLLKIPGA
jgi:hypothetical protein